MAIFGNIEVESTVQVNDKTRINCIKTFVSKDSTAITLVRIKPEASESFIQVGTTSSKDYYLDWEYSTAGTKVITLEITNIVLMAPVVTTFTSSIEVLSVADDKLLSSDQDLSAIEPDILKWIPTGRNTFLNVHRKSQSLILDWLDSIRVWRTDGTKLTKEDLSLTDDLKQLSIYTTLSLIYMGISNKVDDVFLNKAREYANRAQEIKNRGRIQADFNGNGTLESSEGTDMRSYTMVRR
jgi:hypothetical protein